MAYDSTMLDHITGLCCETRDVVVAVLSKIRLQLPLNGRAVGLTIFCFHGNLANLPPARVRDTQALKSTNGNRSLAAGRQERAIVDRSLRVLARRRKKGGQ